MLTNDRGNRWAFFLQLNRSYWKLVDTTKEYRYGYAKCIQVQQITIDERGIYKNIIYVGKYELKYKQSTK